MEGHGVSKKARIKPTNERTTTDGGRFQTLLQHEYEQHERSLASSHSPEDMAKSAKSAKSSPPPFAQSSPSPFEPQV